MRQVAPDLFLICRTELPVDEVDTTDAGMAQLVRDHLGYICDYERRRLVLGHGSLMVVPGTGVAVLLWWHWSRSRKGFVPVNDAGFGFYRLPSTRGLNHPSYCTFETAHEVFVAQLGNAEGEPRTGSIRRDIPE